MVSAKLSVCGKSSEALFLWTALWIGKISELLMWGVGGDDGPLLLVWYHYFASMVLGWGGNLCSSHLAFPAMEPLHREWAGVRAFGAPRSSTCHAQCRAFTLWVGVGGGRKHQSLSYLHKEFSYCNWELGGWQMLVVSPFQWDRMPWVRAEGKGIPIFLAISTWSGASLKLSWRWRERGQIVAQVPQAVSVLTKTWYVFLNKCFLNALYPFDNFQRL